jgi:hypothetical protein
MFLPSAVFMLLSSLHAIVVASTVAKHVNHNLTELLATTAITANLSMLDEIQADMTKFVNSAKTLYTKHFLDDHIGTAESALDASLKAEIHTVHDYFLDLFGSAFVLNNSTCAFAPYVIALCGRSYAASWVIPYHPTVRGLEDAPVCNDSLAGPCTDRPAERRLPRKHLILHVA